ncbi:unnamed protein product [Rangifer tarandus platyrhynchus]|uniref:Uncharacterized protein n=2 Tax=Rangifer tarandus platyrhynchus TaxID=3082113 RepID=A0ABN8Y350_RANTA|nr:unnamed protein product [Rangifer tarandus platyrhynchus]CAI9713165.1 unnamed protein product [Rangifer tarandus platyrhynchus]
MKLQISAPFSLGARSALPRTHLCPPNSSASVQTPGSWARSRWGGRALPRRPRPSTCAQPWPRSPPCNAPTPLPSPPPPPGRMAAPPRRRVGQRSSPDVRGRGGAGSAGLRRGAPPGSVHSPSLRPSCASHFPATRGAAREEG